MSSSENGAEEVTQGPNLDPGPHPPAPPVPLRTADPATPQAPPPQPPYWAQRSPVGAAAVLFLSTLVPIVFIVLVITLGRKTSGTPRKVIFGMVGGAWVVVGVLAAAYGAGWSSASGHPPEAPFYVIGYNVGQRLATQHPGADAQAQCTSMADTIGNGSDIPASHWRTERPPFMEGCLDGFHGNANKYPDEPLPPGMTAPSQPYRAGPALRP